jgi:hypothetical protein
MQVNRRTFRTPYIYAHECNIGAIYTSHVKSYRSAWTCSNNLKATEIIEIDNMQRDIAQEKHYCTESCAEACKRQTE